MKIFQNTNKVKNSEFSCFYSYYKYNIYIKVLYNITCIMKFLKALLYWLCFPLFACLFVSFGIYLTKTSQNEISDDNYETPTITLNVWTWDRTINQMPTLETISLSFPEFGVNNTDFMDCSRTSPLLVKVIAINPIDPDWNISRMRFYYYNIDEPDNILEYKETWSLSPYVYFVIPRIWWEYRFWVILYDNNWWIVDSKDIIWQPSIYLPNPCK